MIRYTLKCADGHRFESWFQSGASFERLKTAGHLSCTICGGTDVEKAIMAPALSTRGGAAVPVPAAPAEASSPAAAPAPAPSETLLSAPSSPLQVAIQALRAHVEATAEDVGTRFADEARAIHDGDTADRPIYGQATRDEARALIEDGVEIAPLPWTTRRDS